MNDLKVGNVTPDDLDPIQVAIYQVKPFSIDNRRLVAFNVAGVKDIPIEIVSLNDPKVSQRFFDRFDPIDNEGIDIVITSTRGRNAAQQLLKDYGKINGIQLRN